MSQHYSLILVHTPGWQDLADFEKIRDHVMVMASNIDVFIVSNSMRSPTTRKKAARYPSLTFSPVKLLEFRPDRGRVYQGSPMSKLAELERLKVHGLPVPHYEPVLPGVQLDPCVFGTWVLLKPTHELSSWGEGIELSRTESVCYVEPTNYPEGHWGAKSGVYAQRYIECKHAMTCRVLTLFGEPILTYVRTAKSPIDLDSLQWPYPQRGFMPVDTDMEITRTQDQDVFDLAKRTYQAIPEAALQACDILRDNCGHLHLLEVNPGGGTWMFSSKYAPAYKKALGVDKLDDEFNAFEKCALLLVERTRMEAC